MGSVIVHLFYELYIIFKIVLGAFLIENITCVAHRSFRKTAGVITHIFYTGLNGFHPVKRIKYSEDIYPIFPGFGNKSFNKIVGIGFISNSIGPPKEHLEQDVW